MDLASKLKRYAPRPRTSAYSEGGPSESGPSILPGFRTLSEDLLVKDAEFPADAVPSLPYSALSLPIAVTGILDLAGPGLPAGDVLFLDTETTGLSIGTGTIPFLIGLAWLEEPGPRWRLRQFFLNSPSAEPALVSELDLLFQRFPYLCTFNGKSYDLPLIRNRFTLQRRRLKGFAHHFDLLHMWKRLLPADLDGGFRQKNLEACILGRRREEDVDGADIPALYFDWMKYGVDNGLSRVALHNELDMHGMVGLYSAAADTMQSAGSDDIRRRIRVGRVLYRNALYDEAIRLLSPLAETSNVPEPDRRLLFSTLGLSCFRTKDFVSAARWMSCLVEFLKRPDDLLFLLRLLEYRVNDYALALDWLDRFPDLLQAEARIRRMQRLKKKLAA